MNTSKTPQSYFERSLISERKLNQMLDPQYFGWFTLEEIEAQRQEFYRNRGYAMGE